MKNGQFLVNEIREELAELQAVLKNEMTNKGKLLAQALLKLIRYDIDELEELVGKEKEGEK